MVFDTVFDYAYSFLVRFTELLRKFLRVKIQN